MYSNGQFEARRYVIGGVSAGIPIHLIPFGDIHEDCEAFSEDSWADFVDKYKGRRDCWFLGMGDYQDFMSASERASLRVGSYHDQTLRKIADLNKRETDRFIKQRVGWMEGRIVGFLEGNHYGQLQASKTMAQETTTQYMARQLGAQYLGVSCFLRLDMVRKGSDKSIRSVDIWACHGHGASRLVGGSLNRVQQDSEKAIARLYLQGHDHKRSAATADRLMLINSRDDNGVRVVAESQHFVRTGAFVRGYVSGMRTYVADAGMNPTNLGVVDLSLTWIRSRKLNGPETESIAIGAST